MKIFFGALLLHNPLRYYIISKTSRVRACTLCRISVTMMPLEICTQRLFNNLIKQNQKLGSDSVLNQSTTMSSVQKPAFKGQHSAFRVQCLESRVQNSASRVQRPTLASRVQKFRHANLKYTFQKQIKLFLLETRICLSIHHETQVGKRERER